MLPVALFKKQDSQPAVTTNGKATHNPLQLKLAALNNTHPVIQRVSKGELSQIAEKKGFKTEDALRTFLNNNNLNDEEIAKASVTEIEGFIEIVMEIARKKEKKERKEENKVTEKLEKNSFRVTAGLELYENTFGEGFTKDIMKLKENDRWLDGGAGLGVAIHDYYQKGGNAKTTAVGYARPQGDNDDQKKIVKELNDNKQFDYLSGKFFSDMNEKEELKTAHKKINVISDYNGVLSYTRTLSEDLQKYLNNLEVGGKIYTNFYAKFYKNETPISVLDWLKVSKGIKVAPQKDSLIIEKTDNDAVVTPLKFISQENIAANNMPQRSYEMS